MAKTPSTRLRAHARRELIEYELLAGIAPEVVARRYGVPESTLAKLTESSGFVEKAEVEVIKAGESGIARAKAHFAEAAPRAAQVVTDIMEPTAMRRDSDRLDAAKTTLKATGILREQPITVQPQVVLTAEAARVLLEALRESRALGSGA